MSTGKHVNAPAGLEKKSAAALLNGENAGLIAVLILLLVVFGLIDPSFLSQATWQVRAVVIAGIVRDAVTRRIRRREA